MLIIILAYQYGWIFFDKNSLSAESFEMSIQKTKIAHYKQHKLFEISYMF